MDSPLIPHNLQKDVFAAVLAAEAAGATTWAAWHAAATRFGISIDEAARIDEAGVDGRWPPLSYHVLADVLGPILDYVDEVGRELRDGEQ